VSNKAFGADKDGNNLNKILASLQYEGVICPALQNIDKARIEN